MSEKLETYEAPVVVDYGEIEDVTKGLLALSAEDSPLGARPLDPVNGS